jgi:hypothetical protein
MADPLLVSSIRRDGKNAASGVLHYRPGTPHQGGAGTTGRGFLAEYDEAILDVKLQTIAQCVSFVNEAGFGPTSGAIAAALEDHMKKDL